MICQALTKKIPESRHSGNRELELRKSLGVSATSAQVFDGLSALKAGHHSLGAGGGEDLIEWFFKEISQGDDSVAVHTAGHHGAVA